MLKLKNIFGLLLFFVAFFELDAQETIILQNSDTISVPIDSILIDKLQNEIEITEDSVVVLPLDSALIIKDGKIIISDTKSFKPDPKRAVIYSAIFPGLGQIYNKKYWKLPILYGGFVGVSYAITWNNSHYTDYLEGYRSILKNDPDDTAWTNLLPYGRTPETVDKKWFTGVLRDQKNYFRYYRDLSIIIGFALYGLGIVDAYVDAQLFEFDVSSDLSMRVEPTIIQKNGMSSYLADGYGFKCSFSF